ncbi:MAG TPA: hypothetical protein VEL74_03615 [Thermoanaerobaculia bacterium]|nr:hypothetical protein [Thermoanaerobaculia bacterium]
MLDDARLRGRTEAETFDRELRERELRDREARLTRLAWGAEDQDPLAALTSERTDRSGGSDVVWRLQQDVERLAGFHNAVLRSKAWKLIQLARRPFGRSW